MRNPPVKRQAARKQPGRPDGPESRLRLAVATGLYATPEALRTAIAACLRVNTVSYGEKDAGRWLRASEGMDAAALRELAGRHCHIIFY